MCLENVAAFNTDAERKMAGVPDSIICYKVMRREAYTSYPHYINKKIAEGKAFECQYTGTVLEIGVPAEAYYAHSASSRVKPLNGKYSVGFHAYRNYADAAEYVKDNDNGAASVFVVVECRLETITAFGEYATVYARKGHAILKSYPCVCGKRITVLNEC